MGGILYILECADGSYYTDTTRTALDIRIAQHNDKVFGGYTANKTPVKLVFSQEFAHIEEAIAGERQIKGWSRSKKLALIKGDFASLTALSKRNKL